MSEKQRHAAIPAGPVADDPYRRMAEEITRRGGDYVQAEALSVAESRQLITDRLASL
jgi:hypothetical protein